jgi:hypothetical protein
VFNSQNLRLKAERLNREREKEVAEFREVDDIWLAAWTEYLKRLTRRVRGGRTHRTRLSVDLLG